SFTTTAGGSITVRSGINLSNSLTGGLLTLQSLHGDIQIDGSTDVSSPVAAGSVRMTATEGFVIANKFSGDSISPAITAAGSTQGGRILLAAGGRHVSGTTNIGISLNAKVDAHSSLNAGSVEMVTLSQSISLGGEVRTTSASGVGGNVNLIVGLSSNI